MKTLFERQFENHQVVKCLNKVQEGCECAFVCYKTSKDILKAERLVLLKTTNVIMIHG